MTFKDKIYELQLEFQQLNTTRPIEEWGEDFRDYLWWSFPIVEPPYLGTPFELISLNT